MRIFLVKVDSTAPGVLDFTITNDSDQALWLAPLCSSVQLASGWMDEERSTLQRLTDAESWFLVRAETSECVRTAELIRIEAGGAKVIDGARWIQDAELSPQPGYYRWDIVFYLRRTPYGKVELGRHVFSDVFRYER